MTTLAAPASIRHEPATDGWAPLVGLVAGRAAGDASILLAPLLAGSIVDGYGVAPDMVGYIMAVQLAGVAFASLNLSPWFPRVDRRLVLGIGLALMIAGNLASAAGVSLMLLFVARFFVGLGEGSVAAISNGIASRTRNPQSTFTVLTLATAFFALAIFALLLLLPELLAQLGSKGVFLAIAVLILMLAPLILRLPQRPLETLTADAPRAEGGGWFKGWGAAGTSLLFAWGLFQVGQNGLWTYVERIGHSIGLEMGQIVLALLVISSAGIVSPLLVGALGGRVGRMSALTGATLLSAAACVAMGFAHTFPTYIAAGTVMTLAFFFAIPFAFALASDVDPSGRVVAAMAGFVAIGSAIGPAAAGVVLATAGGYQAVAILAGLTTVVSYLFLLPVIGAIRNARRSGV